MAPHCTYYSLEWRPLLSHYNGPSSREAHFLYYSLALSLYLAIIMERYEGPQIALTMALHGMPYLAIIMDRLEGQHTALTIALDKGLYIANIMDRLEWQHSDLNIALLRGL
jgi:hypothetical protein